MDLVLGHFVDKTFHRRVHFSWKGNLIDRKAFFGQQNMCLNLRKNDFAPIFHFIWKHFFFSIQLKTQSKISRIFKIFKNRILLEAKFENSIIHKPSYGVTRGTARKFEPVRFSRFDVYWIQTDRQTSKVYT